MSVLASPFRLTFILLVILFSSIPVWAQSPADSVTVTFRTFQSSSPTMFVPGQFNNWGPNSAGVIAAGAASQMTYNGATGAWTKTYTFKIHDPSDTRRTLGDSVFQYKLNQGGTATGWFFDPLNPERNTSDNNNSILRLTKAFWFEVRLPESGGQITAINAGLPYRNSATVTSIVLTYGQNLETATTVTVTSSLNAATRLFDYPFPSSIPKSYFVRLVAYTSEGDSAVYYNEGLNIVTQPVPAYAGQGVTLPSVASNDSTTFVVRAPGRDYVRIRIAPLGQSPASAASVLMRKGIDNYTWWINMKLNTGTYEYLYEMPDGTFLYDPWGLYNGANGSRFSVGGEGLTADNYVWGSTSWTRPPLNRLVIYEMNLTEVVGGYTGKTPGNCKFTDLIPLLAHYDSLGVNCIELMPINDYGGVGPSGFSWGYDPNTHLALEPSYGTPADFKRLVDSAHARGIAILVDVVYNHLNDTGPLWSIAPSLSTNPYFHTAGTNYNEDGTGYFRDLNHWTTETQEYIYASLKMFIDRYKVDGFRFDFTRGIGWDVSQPTKGILGWANRINTEYSGQIYLIAEHLPESPTLISRSGLSSGWHDAFRDEIFNEAANRSTSLDNFENLILDLGAYSAADVPVDRTSYEDRTGPVNMNVNHDEQSLIYEMTQFHGVSSADAVKRDKLYATFMFTSLGIPLLWEGMEHAEPRGWTTSDQRMSYRAVQWNLRTGGTGQAHFQHYKALINLRLNHPAVYQGNLRRLWKYYSQKSLVWGFEDPGSSAKVMAVANLSSTSQTITNVPWLAAGTWYNIFDNTEFVAGGTSIASITIPAYTALVYTNQAVTSPATVTLSANSLNFGDVPVTATSSRGVTISNGGGSTLAVSSVTSSNPKFTVKTSSFSVPAGQSTTDTIRFSPTTEGPDSALIIFTSNTMRTKDTIVVRGNCIVPVVATPLLLNPADAAVDEPLAGTFRWGRATNAARYWLQVTTDSLFGGNFAANDSMLTDTVTVVSLAAETKYFWRVMGIGPYTRGEWATAFSFTTTDQPFTVSASLRAKWNMVSLPAAVADARVAILYPQALSQAFAFTGSYADEDTLKPGIGYWLKSDSARTVVFTGAPLVAESVQVASGWNMIGSISSPIAAASVTSSVPGMIASPFYGYAGMYTRVDMLSPGQGYWVKVDQDGWLYLSYGSSMSGRNAISIVSAGEEPPPPPGQDDAVAQYVPVQFSLEQNYPNPFNPTTQISYTIPVEAFVTVQIVNTLGQQVAVLQQMVQQPGVHAVQWDAAQAPSGMYFYRLDAVPAGGIGGTYSQMRKMVVVK